MEEEIWKDIPGYEGKYQVSSLGRVKSLDRYVRCGTGGRGMRLMKGRILRPGPSNHGHMYVVLGHGKNGSQVHQLVMLTFVGPCPKGMEVCHNNGNPTDNRLENLRYDTRTNNILDDYRHGKPRKKLSIDDVLEIRRLRKIGVKVKDIARQYGLSENYTSSVLRGKRVYWWLTTS